MRTRAPPLAPHNPFPCPDLRSVRDACRKPIAHSCEGREVDVRLKGGARQDVQAPRTIQHQQVLPQGVRAGEGGGASQGHRHTDHRQRTTHGLSLFFAGFLFFSLSPTLGPKVQALPGRLGKSRLVAVSLATQGIPDVPPRPQQGSRTYQPHACIGPSA